MITSYEARCEYGPDRYVFHGNIHETDFLNLDVVVSYSVLVQVRGCWGPILPPVPMNIKGVLGTYSTPGPHEHQGGAGDLFYPRSP